MRILFDSKKSVHKKPFGCIKENEMCHISIHIPKEVNTKRAYLIIEDERGFSLKNPLFLRGENENYHFYETDFSLFKAGLYFYFFKIEKEDDFFFLYKEGFGDTNMGTGEKWQLSCILKDFKTPDFFKGAVFYQIFPDRFYKEKVIINPEKLEPYTLHENESDIPDFLPDEKGEIKNSDFFGGNLPGIEKKLPYLKELGVSAIYLNPIFKAYSNHRYDTADYLKIDPMLGDEKDFVSLCEKARKLNIKIILDGVFSHTGSDSLYFDKLNRYENGAFHNVNSPYRKWYTFKDNNSYLSWWGIDTLPEVNENDPSFTEFIKKAISHWLSLGAFGIRLDVADELPSEFIKTLRCAIKETKKDALLMGEVWEDASNKISYGKRREYLLGEELDSVMNYPFRNFIISFVKGETTSFDFENSVLTICENYPEEILHCLLNILSTHDTERIITHLSETKRPLSKEDRAKFTLSYEDYNKALEKVKMAAFLLFTLPGCPSIYYGDEAGQEGFEDPFNRGFFPWGKEKAELLAFYKRLSSLKNENVSLKKGDIQFTEENPEIIHFKRIYQGESLYFVLCRNASFTIEDKKILFSEKLKDGKISPFGFAVYEK